MNRDYAWVRKRRRHVRILVVICIFAGICAGLVLAEPKKEPKLYGVTYTPSFSNLFGLDERALYQDILHDLKFRNIRISAYWNQIEWRRGTYDFLSLDWQVNEAEGAGAKLIIALGWRVPRWPECHLPTWAVGLSNEERNEALKNYLTAVINRYKDRSHIVMWQVENEPFLHFGECPNYTSKNLDWEIEHVKFLDARPILVTDSGELSLWVPAARRGDVFGTTMYRTVYNKVFGQIQYPIPAWFFRLKRSFAELFVGNKPMMVIELQGEPWIKKPVFASTVEEQAVSMDAEKFRETIEYAERSGFDTFYLWGVEWWYWLKQNGDPTIWNYVRDELVSKYGK